MPLTDSIVQYVMSEVFATINHRLSEEYTKIELPTSDAKERCVHSHRYLRPLLLIFAFFFPPTDYSQTHTIYMRSSQC
jgi:vacuolar protein sorting-associated protein 54